MVGIFRRGGRGVELQVPIHGVMGVVLSTPVRKECIKGQSQQDYSCSFSFGFNSQPFEDPIHCDSTIGY